MRKIHFEQVPIEIVEKILAKKGVKKEKTAVRSKRAGKQGPQKSTSSWHPATSKVEVANLDCAI